jgi:hypothetical protein
MLKRLFQWFKQLFQGLSGKKTTRPRPKGDVQKEPPPPLSDTDLEFLFNELLEGVYQMRGQTWALKWLNNLEKRVPTSRWVEWLQRFGNKLLASSSPNNELAARLVQLGELGVGEIGDVAYDIGMQILTRNQPEPIWEYAEPDSQQKSFQSIQNLENHQNSQHHNYSETFNGSPQESTPMPADGEFQTVTLEELFDMMQHDGQLRQLIAQQVGVETDDPEIIMQVLVDQLLANQQADEGQG